MTTDADSELDSSSTEAVLDVVVEKPAVPVPLLPVGVSITVSVLFVAANTFVLEDSRHLAMFDDALISMNYARNLARGFGLIWSPGGTAVEGYTNPLWTLVMSGIHRAGFDQTTAPFALALVTSAILVGCVVVAARVAALLSPGSRMAPTVAGLLVALDYPLVYWSLRGTEEGLFTLLMLSAMWAVARVFVTNRAGRAELLLVTGSLVLGVSTRTDFIVPATVIFAWAAIALRGRARRDVLFVAAIAVIVTLGLHTAWRELYYNALLPNTYTLKVGGVSLAARIGRGVLSSVVFTVTRLAGPALIVVLALRLRARISRHIVVLLVATAIAIVGYSTSVGGDAWEWTIAPNRFLVPAGVLGAILAGACLEPVVNRVIELQRIRWLYGIGAVVVFGGWFGWDGLTAAGVPLDRLANASAVDGSMVLLSLSVLALGILAIVFFTRAQFGNGQLRDRSRARVTSVVLVLLIFGLNGAGIYWFAGARDTAVGVPRAMAELGLQIKAVTTPDATVAVVWAGAPVYFSDRMAVDLLGKADRVVANSPPHAETPFLPGHVKWDYSYSVGVLRPDLVAQVYHATPTDLDAFVADGYEPVEVIGSAAELNDPLVQNKMFFARKDSPNLRWEALKPILPYWH